MGIRTKILDDIVPRALFNLQSALRSRGTETFIDDAQCFSKGKLAQRRKWRDVLRSSGEAKRLRSLRNRHKGRRAFIIGNGPSIKGQDLTKLKDEVTFVTNWFANHDDYENIQPTYYCISSHEVFGGWSAQNPKLNAEMREAIVQKTWRSHHFFPLWARNTILSDEGFSAEQSNFLIFEKPKATVLERGRMNWDILGNLDDGMTGVITFCLPLALHMGIQEVFLVGCDCDYGISQEKDAKQYFYDFSKHTTSTSKFETLDRVWGQGGEIFQIYEIVRREAERRGLRIYNATRGGLLEVFPRVNYEDIVK